MNFTPKPFQLRFKGMGEQKFHLLQICGSREEAMEAVDRITRYGEYEIFNEKRFVCRGFHEPK